MAIEKLQNIFREVFGDDNLILAPQTSAKDVETWDSFNHINLIVALEEAYSMTFTTEEMAGMANVGDLVTLLQQKGKDVAW